MLSAVRAALVRVTLACLACCKYGLFGSKPLSAARAESLSVEDPMRSSSSSLGPSIWNLNRREEPRGEMSVLRLFRL